MAVYSVELLASVEGVLEEAADKLAALVAVHGRCLHTWDHAAGFAPAGPLVLENKALEAMAMHRHRVMDRGALVHLRASDAVCRQWGWG